MKLFIINFKYKRQMYDHSEYPMLAVPVWAIDENDAVKQFEKSRYGGSYSLEEVCEAIGTPGTNP